MKERKEIIKLENISKRFGNKEVLKAINLEIYEKERFGIFGPSGCGKTTFLRIISGLERPDKGSIYLRGNEASSNNVFVEPEKRNLSFIFQDLALWPHMSVKEHLEFVLSDGFSKSEREYKIEEILRMVDLSAHTSAVPEKLSGGEKQRLALARAIAQNSDIFLFDEPLSSLDISLKEKMKTVLRKLQKKYGLTILYVTHDIFEIMGICDRIALMADGEIIKIGHPAKLLKLHLSRITDKI